MLFSFYFALAEKNCVWPFNNPKAAIRMSLSIWTSICCFHSEYINCFHSEYISCFYSEYISVSVQITL